MIIREGNLEFTFDDGISVIKFDNTQYYNTYKDCLDGGKGVDFLAFNNEYYTFIEVKDFQGSENDKNNILRLKTNGDEVETLDLEVSKKVRSSLACLFGSHIKQNAELEPFFKALKGKLNNANGFTPKVDIVLILEGNVEKMIAKKGMKLEKVIAFQNITRSMKKKLKWLTDRVSVESIDTKKSKRFFSIQRIGQA